MHFGIHGTDCLIVAVLEQVLLNSLVNVLLCCCELVKINLGVGATCGATLLLLLTGELGLRDGGRDGFGAGGSCAAVLGGGVACVAPIHVVGVGGGQPPVLRGGCGAHIALVS